MIKHIFILRYANVPISGLLTPTTWIHAVATFKQSSGVKIYHDGSQASTIPTKSAISQLATLYCSRNPSYTQEHHVSQAHIPVVGEDQTTCLIKSRSTVSARLSAYAD